MNRIQELMEMTRRQIYWAIESDLRGELIMKEVWEHCEDDREQRVVEREMRAIMALIKKRGLGRSK